MRAVRKPADAAPTAALNDLGEGRYALAGELSFAGVPALLPQGKTLFAGKTAIELDLAGVYRADSAGLALLVEWLVEARKQDRQLSFRHVPEQILRMAKVAGLEDILALT